MLIEWLNFNERNHLKCYIVWLTAQIAFTKVSLALLVIHKEEKMIMC